MVIFYQACGDQLTPEGNDARGSGVTSEPIEIDSSTLSSGLSINPFQTEITLEDIEEGNGVAGFQIGEDGLTVNKSVSCEADCVEDLECDLIGNAGLRTNCENQCITSPPGICAPEYFASDPVALKSFTVPAGYKKATVSVSVCMREASFIIEGSSMRFTGNFNCNDRRYRHHKDPRNVFKPTVELQLYNDDGSKANKLSRNWVRPGTLSFSLHMIPDVDLGEPIFMLLESVYKHPGSRKRWFKRGVFKNAVYDNSMPGGQLSFIIDLRGYGYRSYWNRWIGGKGGDNFSGYRNVAVPVGIKFDLYYKKGSNPLGENLNP